MGENSSSKPTNQTEKQRNHLYSGRICRKNDVERTGSK